MRDRGLSELRAIIERAHPHLLPVFDANRAEVEASLAHVDDLADLVDEFLIQPEVAQLLGEHGVEVFRAAALRRGP